MRVFPSSPSSLLGLWFLWEMRERRGKNGVWAMFIDQRFLTWGRAVSNFQGGANSWGKAEISLINIFVILRTKTWYVNVANYTQ